MREKILPETEDLAQLDAGRAEQLHAAAKLLGEREVAQVSADEGPDEQGHHAREPRTNGMAPSTARRTVRTLVRNEPAGREAGEMPVGGDEPTEETWGWPL